MNLPPVLGYYRFVWAGGPEILTAPRPYYGRRTIWLPMVKRWVNQILVPFLGKMIWINMPEGGE